MTERPTVLITGATGNLGREMALGFSRLGHWVAFTSRGGDAAIELQQACRAAGAAGVLGITVDLTADDAAARVVDALAAAAMAPDILINNARNVEFLRSDNDGTMAAAHWRGEFALGVMVPYQLTTTLLAASGSRLTNVINIASMYGVVAPNLALYADPTRQSPINYGVVKAGLIHLTKELAVRLAGRGVRVNAISYGGVEGRVDAAFKLRYAALCPSGRMLGRDEVFGPVQFLASDAASGMTGHNLVVDGGWSTW